MAIKRYTFLTVAGIGDHLGISSKAARETVTYDWTFPPHAVRYEGTRLWTVESIDGWNALHGKASRTGRARNNEAAFREVQVQIETAIALDRAEELMKRR